MARKAEKQPSRNLLIAALLYCQRILVFFLCVLCEIPCAPCGKKRVNRKVRGERKGIFPYRFQYKNLIYTNKTTSVTRDVQMLLRQFC